MISQEVMEFKAVKLAQQELSSRVPRPKES